MATNISPKPDVPKWDHFNSFHTDKPLSETDITRAFLPICRYSDIGLEALEERYARGWFGHPEILVPTSTTDAGLTLEDFGGDKPFVSPQNVNRFYTASR